MLKLSDILSVIVLYKSSLDNSTTFQTILKSIEDYNSNLVLFVVNNSPDYWSYNNKKYEGLEIVYTEDASNSGVSKAYNLGFEYAKKSKKQFVLTLDQDTNLPLSFFKNFFHSQKQHQNIELFCSKMVHGSKLISPSYFSVFYRTKTLKSIDEGVHKLKGLAIINSGLIISSKLFDKVGGYNEKIKLDFSDFDFLKRVEYHENEVFVLDNICQHELSGEQRQTKEKVLFRYQYYIEGAINYKKNFYEGLCVYFWVFMRTLKLCFLYKTSTFMFLLFKRIIK